MNRAAFGAEGRGGGFAADGPRAGPTICREVAGEFGGDVSEPEGKQLLCGHDIAP